LALSRSARWVAGYGFFHSLRLRLLRTSRQSRRKKEGADFVIVPAMSRDDDPAVLEWIKGQAARSAAIHDAAAH